MKRLLDVLISAAAIVALSPIILIAFVLASIDSKGRPIFSQTRLTKGRKPFRIYKFRTMRDGASGRTAAQNLCCKDADDWRITRIGRILRKTSVDELPQLINVLIGDMSLIGPRPCLVEEEPYLTDSHFRHRAGLTGPVQLHRDEELTLDRINALDASYGPKDDLVIFLKTFKVLLKGK